jgi:hypothetical protein
MKKHFFNTSSLRLIGFVSGLIGIGLILLAVFWDQPLFSKNNTLNETRQFFQAEGTGTQDSTKTPRFDQSFTTPNPDNLLTGTRSPALEWMVYDGIDFRDKEVDALFIMQCDQEVIHLEPFRIVPYSPEIMRSGEFSNNRDFSVAWEHLGYYGLWIHSGLAYNIGELTAYPLQINIEQDARGFFRTPNEVSQYLDDCVIHAELRMHQDDSISVNAIVAAVRVPPSEVNEVSRHVMDLVPYLAETYPDSGFNQLSPPGLIFYFCGQQLTGEMANPNYNQWTQARFVIGVMPLIDE